MLDGAQAAMRVSRGGDGLAVLPAVGAFGEVAGMPLDFAEVGFAFVGVPARLAGREFGGGGGPGAGSLVG